MDELQVGDLVLVSHNHNPNNYRYEPVYVFGHYDKEATATFRQLYTSTSILPLEMTGNHLLAVTNKNNQQPSYIPVKDLVIGDLVTDASSGGLVPIDAITTVERKGLYMPLTASGTIVVNGIVASTYVSVPVLHALVNAPDVFFLTEQRLSHWWMSPYRMLCNGLLSSSESGLFNTRMCSSPEQGILPWFLVGLDLAETFEGLSRVIGLLVLGLPLFLLFATCYAMEAVLLFGGSSTNGIALLVWIIAVSSTGLYLYRYYCIGTSASNTATVSSNKDSFKKSV